MYYDWLKWSLLVCKEVGYELSPSVGWVGGSVLGEEEATDWIRRLAANVDTLCFEPVGVSVDDLRGVEWLNRVGRAARDGYVVVDMQNLDEVKTVWRIMENLKCLWPQVDVSGGGWAPCDTLVVVDDRYMVAGAIGEAGVGASVAVALAPVPQVALPLRVVAGELGLTMGGSNVGSDVDLNVDMESSPLAVRARRRLRGLGGRPAVLRVSSVVLFPVGPVLPALPSRPVCKGTVLNSVGGTDSLFNEDPMRDDDLKIHDPACGGGGRGGECECSCKGELGHLIGKVRRLEDIVRLLVASAGLARWEETRRVENLRKNMGSEREEAERVHARKVVAERAAIEERRRLARRDEQARKA